MSDADYPAAMVREAHCVVFSERFNRFDEAKRHYNHGSDYGRSEALRTLTTNDFNKYLKNTRELTAGFYNNEMASANLRDFCDTQLTIAQFNAVP